VLNISSRRAIVPGIAALALALSACGGGASDADGVAGEVAVDGSSTVYPMSATAYEFLSEENADIKVSVGFSGTGGGFEKFCAGTTDVSNASRPIKDEEAAACEENGVEFTELQVATDALTIVTHPDLGVDCLTTAQVGELFGPEATAKKWSDLDPSFPDTKIAGFIPGADSGTYDYMAADVIGHDVLPGWSVRIWKNPGAAFQSAYCAAAWKLALSGSTYAPSRFCTSACAILLCFA
jgi:phosphate transport system substrate-binding protein